MLSWIYWKKQGCVEYDRYVGIDDIHYTINHNARKSGKLAPKKYKIGLDLAEMMIYCERFMSLKMNHADIYRVHKPGPLQKIGSMNVC